jgi:hypothetical protein
MGRGVTQVGVVSDGKRRSRRDESRFTSSQLVTAMETRAGLRRIGYEAGIRSWFEDHVRTLPGVVVDQTPLVS